MFTGIVEEVGKVVSLEASGSGGRILLQAEIVLQGTRVADSILVNGACLTASSISGDKLEMDLLAETLSKTNLGSLRPSDIVNLERSLTPQSRMGGHFVMGHVDGTGTITSFEKRGRDFVLEIEAPGDIIEKLSPKGSIAVDGISLTVVSLAEQRFTVHIIPHTLKATNMKSRKPGDRVNLEIDILARYLHDFLHRHSKMPGVTEDLLRHSGFK